MVKNPNLNGSCNNVQIYFEGLSPVQPRPITNKYWICNCEAAVIAKNRNQNQIGRAVRLSNRRSKPSQSNGVVKRDGIRALPSPPFLGLLLLLCNSHFRCSNPLSPNHPSSLSPRNSSRFGVGCLRCHQGREGRNLGGFYFRYALLCQDFPSCPHFNNGLPLDSLVYSAIYSDIYFHTTTGL